MATHKLALVIKSPLTDDDFLLVKQSRPPKFDHEEYDSYVDSDLWDLPSAQLNPLQGDSESQVGVEVSDSNLAEINLKEFDIRSALKEVVFLNLEFLLSYVLMIEIAFFLKNSIFVFCSY